MLLIILFYGIYNIYICISIRFVLFSSTAKTRLTVKILRLVKEKYGYSQHLRKFCTQPLFECAIFANYKMFTQLLDMTMLNDRVNRNEE